MSKTYIHSKYDKKSLIKKMYIALIPLLIYGFYKNGILLYSHQLISFLDMLIPLYVYGISIVVGLLVSFILKEKAEENVLTCLMVSCTVSINSNMLLYPIVLFIGLFLLKVILNKSKLKINKLASLHFILLLSLLVNSYSYLNIAEKLNKFHYGLWDIFFGNCIGGIAVTSLFLVIISLIYLSVHSSFKKNIAITSSLSFFLIFLSLFAITQNSYYLKIMLSGNTYFVFVFMASALEISPDTDKGMAIYGFLIGLLSAIFTIFLKEEGVYLAILLCSLAIPFINYFINKKYFKL